MLRLAALAGSLVDQIKVNVLTREVRDGRAYWLKRRRRSAKPIMAVADRFFALAGNPVRTVQDLAAWQHWEISCFEQLHGGEFRAFSEGKRTVGAEELPGKTLAHHLDARTLRPEMLAAAGRELRRAHAWHCEAFAGPWSHGDPHSGNFVYDAATNRARLIDFEVMHQRSLSAEQRHADDLLVFLQDLVGRISPALWISSARTFLEGYDQPEIIRALGQRLVIPRGLARVWWSVRTTYLSRDELARRIGELRAALPSICG